MNNKMSKELIGVINALKDNESIEIAKIDGVTTICAKNEVNYFKGYLFEKWIIEHFREEDGHALLEWRSDKSVHGSEKETRCPESSKFPDLVFQIQHNNIEMKFAVECKYRTKLTGNTIVGARYISSYRKYASMTNQIVFIMIGVGGKPSDPEQVYLIPLHKIETDSLTKSALEAFELFLTDKFYKFDMDSFSIRQISHYSG